MKFKFPFSLKGLKKINRNHLILAALAGVLLLVIALPTGNTGKEDGQNRAAEQDIGAAAKAKAAAESNSAYKKNMELQLEKTLGAMEGVGQVEVMLTLQDTGEAVVEKDVTRNEERTAEEDSEGTKRENSVINSQEETIYIQNDGSGGTPFVAKEVNPRVEGVLVVAQGAGSAAVVKNISDAVMALFPVEAHKIKVVKMSE